MHQICIQDQIDCCPYGDTSAGKGTYSDRFMAFEVIKACGRQTVIKSVLGPVGC